MSFFKRSHLIFLFLVAFIVLTPKNIFADDIYVFYEQKEERLLTKNLLYSAYRQITNQGMRDFYVLRVPLNDPNITVKSAESLKEYGLKETVKNLLVDNKAIAGVNGDFFGLKGNYSAPFGIVVNDGKLISLNPNINSETAEYSSFAIDSENNPFMTYVKSEISFLNDGQKNVDIATVNKITDMTYPTYVDRNAMPNTELLDGHFPDLTKLVISNGKIIYISQKGETVEIPEDGYIITMGTQTADYNLDKFSVGQKAEFLINSTVDLDKIKTMFGGAGRILIDGQPTNDSGLIIKGRSPRTALGLTYDKNTLIIMVVDGRTHSIGATQTEMAQLMQRFGAYDAMHLDGGGSTTMVVQDKETNNLSVVNTPSDGSQRKVINAVGVFKPNEMGELSKVEIENDRLLYGLPNKINVYGYDEYLNKIEILQNDFMIYSDDSGEYRDGYFYPNKIGKIKVSANYKNLSAEKEVTCSGLNFIEPVKDVLELNIGEQNDLNITAVNDENIKSWLDVSDNNLKINFEVVPNNLGKIESGKFTALNNGVGYVKCSLGDAVCYTKIIVGGADKIDDKKIDIPENPKYKDKLNIDFGEINGDAFDVFCVGNIFLSDKQKTPDYKNTINKYLSSIEQNASLGLIVGKTDGDMSINAFRQNDYYVDVFKNLTVASLTAKNGGLFKTKPNQWQNFEQDIASKNTKNIIIMIDQNPADFKQPKEYELFHNVLKKFVGVEKKVFVLYPGNNNSIVKIKDGVRYICLGSYFKDKEINPNYRSLRFRITGDDIFYKFE